MPDQRAGFDLRSTAEGVLARRSLAVWIWSILLIADAVLITRRLSGEFADALPGSLAFFSTTLVALASWTAWSISAASFSQRSVSDSLRLIPLGISVAVVVLWGWSISPGATPLTCGLLVAVILLQAGALAAGELLATNSGSLRLVPPNSIREMPTDAVSQPCEALTTPPMSDELATRHSPLATPSAFEEEESEESEGDADEDQTLWLSRRQTADGEQIEGWVRVHFAPGQREAVIHVAFCPPLSGSPEIETEDLNGVGLEIRVAAIFPFGARLSVRRRDTLEERHSDRIGFIAQIRSVDRAA